MSDRRGTDPAEPGALSGRSLGDGVENPLRNLKIMLMGGCRIAAKLNGTA